MNVIDRGEGPMLHIAGLFSSIGGVSTGNVAWWNGKAWESIGNFASMSSARGIVALEHDGIRWLYVAEAYFNGGRVARWDGQTWSPLPNGGIVNIGITAVHNLHVFDDGRGPALYITGIFVNAGGVTVRNVVRFDGQNYEPLGAGMSASVNDIVTHNDGRGESIFFVGSFQTAGGGQTPGIAQWVGCKGQCYPNCDNSTIPPVVNIADFSCFLQKFAKNDPYANCNVDATIDIADFACFLQKFAAGCP
jgi:hypothetical protein